ncbi:hypothetical protein GC173_05065 [bacterium]|nr:hypothetical protein [bacterium]
MKTTLAAAILALLSVQLHAAPAGESAAEFNRRINEALSAGGKQSSAPTPAPAAPTTTSAAPTDYKKLVQQIQLETEALWGGRVGHPVKSNVLNKSELGELLERLMKEESQEKTYIDYMALQTFLRVIPSGADADSLFGDLLQGQVGGLYNPDDKSLYVVDTFDPKGFIGGVILSHEITHAVQDAAWNLTTYAKDVEELDRHNARMAAVEGDATVSMIEWGRDNFTPAVLLQINQMFSSQAEDLNKVPQPIVQDLIFPYLAGSTFCIAVSQHKGPDWRVYLGKNPPNSTEQILHPEKYLAEPREEPLTVTLPAPPAGLHELHRNTMGEWGMRVYLAQKDEFPRITMLMADPLLNAPIPTEAAAGWGGDQFTLLAAKEDGEPSTMAWRTVWDTEKDATEFIDVLRRRMKSEGAVHLSTTTGKPGQLYTWAKVSGKQVDLLLTYDRDLGQAALKAYFGQ